MTPPATRNIYRPLDRDITTALRSLGGRGSKRKKQLSKTTMTTTTTDRLTACLKDNSMTDVALVGDDGVPIPAIRCVLGSASPVLKQLLYTTTSSNSRFRGRADSLSSSSEILTSVDDNGFAITLEPQNSLFVHIPGFRSETIRALVEFCCSDGDLTQQTLFLKPDFDSQNVTTTHNMRDPAQAVIDMLDFAQMAISYEIPKVPQQVVDEFVTPLTKRYPPLACIVYNYLLTVEFADRPNQLKEDSASSDSCPWQVHSNSAKEAKEAEKVISAAAALTKLYTIALNMIRTQPYAALTPWEMTKTSPPEKCVSDLSQSANGDGSTSGVEGVGGVLALDAETLEKILQDREVEADELFLFRQLQRWHDHHKAIETRSREDSENMDNNDAVRTDDQSNITETLKELMNGKAIEALNIDEDEDDSFQFQAAFNEFVISNADTVSFSFSSKDSLLNHDRQKEDCGETHDDKGFKTIESWHPTFSTVPEHSGSTLDETSSCPDPTSVCRELVRHLDLTAIDPVPLKEIVSTADFVEQELVMNALWEQVTSASELGRISFGSVVRGTGGPGMNVQDVWADLKNRSIDTKKESRDAPPQHQHFKSHILVQGAGVEECNGIYTQVMRQATKESNGRVVCPVHDEDTVVHGACPTFEDRRSDTKDVPMLMCVSSASTDSSQTACTRMLDSTINISTGVCLRFVKKAKRRQHRSKTWYLACRRELVPADSIKRGNAAPFNHQWSLIEEDNRMGGRLQVLYEWEPEEDFDDCSSGSEWNPQPNMSSALVFDSNTLQRFPENGWTCIRQRYLPAPSCKWFRSRHGSPVLVIPPVVATKVSDDKPQAALALAAKRMVPPPPPPPPLPTAHNSEQGLSAKGQEITTQDPPPHSLPLDDLSRVGLPVAPSLSFSDSEEGPKKKVLVTATHKNESLRQDFMNRLNTINSSIDTVSNASSAFRLDTARRRVSLADGSLSTSDAKMSVDVEITYEI